jgi:hypothetical protein
MVRGEVLPLTQDSHLAKAIVKACDKYESGEDYRTLVYLLMLKTYPVDIRTFTLEAPYLNMGEEIFPKVLDYLEDLNNPNGDRLALEHYEAVWTGGIGTAKTTQALITTAYQLYLLSCFRAPAKVLGQAKSAEILFIFQSLNGGVSRDVDYKRFRSMLENSEYFTKTFPFRPDLESRMVFPHRIEVKPVHGEVTATIGQNVYGGIMDEVNFMAVIAGSKKTNNGEVYDQARELYESVASRRSSRFSKQGVMPGIFCLVSSKNYPGQFTDVKAEESKKDKGIWYFDKVVWEVKSVKDFSGVWFNVFVGDITRKPRILEDGEKIPETDKHLIKAIPMEYKIKFERDIYNALREVAGVSTLAKSPFITDVAKIFSTFDKQHKSILSRTDVDFHTTQLAIHPERFRDKEKPRWVHIDLGLTSDAAGFSMGYMSGFREVLDDEGSGKLMMPEISMDCTLRVMPPKNGEINFSKIRAIIYKLDKLGVNIKWISFDSYQSVDSIQMLRAKGYTTGQVSMDKTPIPYEVCKTAISDGRIITPEDDHLRLELAQLERTASGKIDHPPNGSKDIADSFTAVVYGLTSRSELWHEYGIPPNQALLEQLSKSHASVSEENN